MKPIFLTLLLAGACYGQHLPGQNPLTRPEGHVEQRKAYLDQYSDYDDIVDGPLYNSAPQPPQSPVVEPSRPRPRRPIGPPPSGAVTTESKLRPGTQFVSQDCRGKFRTRPHEDYCDLYYTMTGCDDGQALLRSCPNGLVYTGSGRHGLINVCDYPHRADCHGKERHSAWAQSQKVIKQQDPCQAKSKVVSDVTYCDRYWECIQGVPELYDCPNGLVWVGKHRGIADGCDYPWRNPSLCQNKDLANPPISTEHCDWLYGIFGHETSCTRYWTCWNGTATEQFCVGGLLYNEETHACDWPQNVGGCQKHPLCKDDANGNVPLGKSCNRYWACQGGYPRLQRCPAMLVFDRLRKRCVAPPTEDCDVPPTTSRPKENDEQGQQQGQQQGGGQGGELRGRGQQRRGPPPQVQVPQGALPFNLPEGAQLLARPQN